ncbi:SAF domain-containing protein [Streptosporangium sp. KLBMP 9127]|nr:hypothetical protein [Streptosporangium sp. KLBMP 9127]
MLLGGLVVMGCSFATTTITLRSQVPDSALAVQTHLPSGHTLAKKDLRVVKAVVGPDVTFIPADRAEEIVGRQLTVPLVSGAVLTEANLGKATFPQPGQALIGVAVKPGQYPPDVAPGDRVALSTIPGSAVAADSRTKLVSTVAVVTKVDRPEQPQDPAVVTLLLPQTDAQLVSGPAAQGLVTLMQVSPVAP